ncbi:hypothetical protein YYE_02961 [Plasmodium vinckei vinckei]|nr:hypothetical protein YYE_02961 [Plasmodium vinckei vinckei]
MRIKGYFIKIRKDGNYMDLNQEDTFYFNIAMHKDKYRLIHNLQPLNPEVAELITNLTREE